MNECFVDSVGMHKWMEKVTRLQIPEKLLVTFARRHLFKDIAGIVTELEIVCMTHWE